MTLTTPYSATFIVGDGETKTFSYLFEEVSPNFISVMVYNSLTGLISTPTYIIDTDQKQVIFGEDTPAPSADETVCIYRNTPNVQDVAFRTLHGYDAQTLENILSKIVAMIQEIKSNYFSTQVLQGDPWQLDLLSSADDGATVNIDYTAKKLVKGLYFKITSGNLQVSADGTNYITMPKSDDVAEFRQYKQTLPDLKVIRKLQYRVGNTWYNAESNAESTANKALQVAEEARDIANDAKDIAQDTSDKVDTFDARLTIAEQDSSDAKELAQEASESVGQFDARITQAEQNANQAKTIATNASTAVNNHITKHNNPHQVTKAQVGLGNVDNTSDLNKPVSTATQTALNTKADKSEIPTVGNGTITITQGGITKGTFTTNQGSNATIALDAGGGGGAVDSVNGKTGVVVLTATDVGALPDNTVIPDAQIQSDWNQADNTKVDFIKNKPTIPAAQVNSDWNANSGVAQILNKPTIPTVNNSTITITQGGEPKGSFTTNQATPTTIELDQGGSGSGHNVGDTFLTTRTDNELNGAVECNGATYNTTDFTGAQSIGELLAAGKVPYVSLSVYAVTIASQGWCDTFGWDGVGTTAFRVPTIDLRHQIVETQEPTEDNDYTWYRWYANDWIEQGGITESSSGSTAKNVVFPIEMADTNYTALVTIYSDLPFGSPGNNPGVQNTNSTTGMTIYSGNMGALYWEVKGMTVPTPHTNRRVMVQLAVSATDEAVATCTGVLADVAANTAAIAEADYVVESQLPTAGNDYTWYRKYKSGWVEQGQYKRDITKKQANIVTLPVPMADTNFGGIISCANTTYGSATTLSIDSHSTTQVNLWGYTSASASTIRVSWEVKGMAAS